MVSYVVKEKNEIVLKQFKYVGGITVGLSSEMFLNEDEIVYDIIKNRLTEDDKIYFKKAERDDFIMEHMGFGMWIRNTYGLWEAPMNPLIEEDCAPDSMKHPDNLSSKIMELVSQALRGEFTPNVSFAPENFDDAMKLVGGD